MFDFPRETNSKPKEKGLQIANKRLPNVSTVPVHGSMTLPKWDQSSSSSDEENSNDLQKSLTLRTKLEMCFNSKVLPYEEEEQRLAVYKQYANGLIARIQRNTSFVRGLNPIHVGSSDDGLSLATSDFNILIPLSVGNSVVRVVEIAPGCVTLKLPPAPMLKERNDKWLGWRSAGGYLCPTLANKMFHGFATQWLEIRGYNDVTIEPYDVVNSRSVRVSIKRPSVLTITIEVIPALKLHGFQFPFIAKKFQFASSPMAWSMVTYEREKVLLKSINMADNNCRSKALCVLKYLRLHDSVLANLTTYQMKTCLLHIADCEIDETKWRKQTVDRCFIKLIETLMKFIENKELPHFFIKGINLFEDFNKDTLDKVYTRLNVLKKREKELGRLLAK
ncbi:cyclic GMP-AMP synthase-like [Anneissia japonica]|uniref:cyclic GMP-AMP synthase-like n=1 Tax=Anneissia japonica TaxID=1529436 RepID=UPI0014255D44|nr:cyclic GMP-AMP synthase-like [Anneissia japonica]